MYYILKASTKAFIINQNNEIVITSDYTKATQYPRIGDAMKKASEVNGALGTHVIKVQSIG